MNAITKTVAALGAIVASATVTHAAQAAAPHQGVYVIVNPYYQVEANMLKTAAQTPCTPDQQSATTPFCGATNGIMLRIPWCDFQLYHINNAKGQPYASCHYQVAFSGDVNSPGVQLPSTDSVSHCAGSFDVCAGRVQSTLGVSLRYISQINAHRASAGLAPLKLSVGMFAGIGTPESVLNSVGYVDAPHTLLPATDPSKMQCFRLPMLWKPQFLSAYNAAVDQLVAYIQMQFPQGSNLVILKAAAISGVDLELEMPGRATAAPVPADPGAAGPAPVLNCSSSVPGAQVWLDAYNANPIMGENFSQANEAAFATVIGHEVGMLANVGLPHTLISVATTNGSGFPNVDCGVSGAGTCTINPAAGNWDTYYIEQYTNDLFNGGLAWSKAAAAYSAIRQDTFSFAPAQFSINSTALSPAPVGSSTQISCTMNNVFAAHAQNFRLDGTQTYMTGYGTTVGWQTATQQGGTCSSGSYMQALNNGIANGGQFIEVESDAAFTDIAQCSPALSSALTQIIAGPPSLNCAY